MDVPGAQLFLFEPFSEWLIRNFIYIPTVYTFNSGLAVTYKTANTKLA